MKKKILLSGVCYIANIIEMKHTQKTSMVSTLSQEDFDISKVKLCSKNIEEDFIVTTQRKYDSIIPTSSKKFQNLGSLLSFYEQDVSSMYFVLQLHIMQKYMNESYTSKSSNFWFFVDDPLRSIHQQRKQLDDRFIAINIALEKFPKLKFVILKIKELYQIKKAGLPLDRFLYWNVDWGDKKTFMERKQIFIQENKKVSHQYPTDNSYNDLYYMLLDDDKKNRSVLDI